MQTHKDTQTEPLLLRWLGTNILLITGIIGFFLVQLTTLFMALVITSHLYPEKIASTDNPITLLESDGTLLAISIILNLVILVVICCTIIKLRKNRITAYLAVRRFNIKTAFIILGMLLAYMLCTETLFQLFNREPMDFLDSYYQSAEPRWLLVIGIVIFAPIYEEVIFRGLLWKAVYDNIINTIAHKTASTTNTPSNTLKFLEKWAWLISSAVTGLLFAGIHLQYELFEVSTIFFLALIFGYARHRSGSLLLPIGLHIINNAVAMAQYILLG